MTQETTQWNEMTSNWMNTWAETNSQIWKSWMELMGGGSFRELMDDTQSKLGYATQRFTDNQQILFRFFKLSLDAWKDIFPKVESGQDWQQTLKSYTEQMRTQLDEFSTGNLKASQDMTRLWQLYIKETQKFSQLWVSALGSFLKPMGKTIAGTDEPWLEMNDLYWNILYEETFGSLMQSPIFGPTREFTGKMLRGFDAWTNLYRASIDYEIILADVQVRSFEELMGKLVALAEKGQKIEDWRQFQQIWSQVADEVFEKAFCSEDKLKVRGKFLNALNTYRLHQQQLMELWMKAMNIPLRSEVDEIHKSVYELRKEVKRLSKALAKYEAPEPTNQPQV
jgi:class III poly(R)-hydroxyalkanoic acid synthase PhaE subunit